MFWRKSLFSAFGLFGIADLCILTVILICNQNAPSDSIALNFIALLESYAPLPNIYKCADLSFCAFASLIALYLLF